MFLSSCEFVLNSHPDKDKLQIFHDTKFSDDLVKCTKFILKAINHQKVPNESTTSSTSVATTIISTTHVPPRVGEVTANISMTCSFNDTFEDDYKVKGSKKYNDYEYRLTIRIRLFFSRSKFLRLILIIFNSFSKGSVVAEMNIQTAANITNNATVMQSLIADILGPDVNITASSTNSTRPLEEYGSKI